MDRRWILPAPEAWARLNAYIEEVGLPWSAEECEQGGPPLSELPEVLHEGRGRTLLDASCGWGRQSIALAKVGWRVTACDISETSLEHARQFAARQGAAVQFRVCDMRDLAQAFDRQFDWVISCGAMHEIPTDDGVRRALEGMYAALKPGGQCYLRLRDLDELADEQPRHVFHGERRTPNGRVICIEDWDYESDDQFVEMCAFLREDERRDPSDHFRWTTETIGYRKNLLRKAKLQRLLADAGFDPVALLPKAEPWLPVEVIATRPR